MGLRRYELVTLAAARGTGSRHCRLAHGVKALGVFDEDQLERIARDYADAGLSDAEVAMMRFAERVARDASSMSEDDSLALREAGFSDREIVDIAIAASSAASTSGACCRRSPWRWTCRAAQRPTPGGTRRRTLTCAGHPGPHQEMDHFTDRRDAGRRLARAFAGRTIERPVVLGLPRGGCPSRRSWRRHSTRRSTCSSCASSGSPGSPRSRWAPSASAGRAC